MARNRFPRDKEELLREVDVRMRLGDIRRLHALRERLSARWWEPAMVVILFFAALGLLSSVFLYSQVHEEPIHKWILFWFGLMILTSVLCFQLVLFRIYNFRRAHDLLARLAEEQGRRLDALESKAMKPREAPAEPQSPPAAPGES